jgi:hypothetical protein
MKNNVRVRVGCCAYPMNPNLCKLFCLLVILLNQTTIYETTEQIIIKYQIGGAKQFNKYRIKFEI